MNTIYLALPISGRDYDSVVNDISNTKTWLESFNFQVLHPMTGKSYLRNETKFKAEGYKNPASSNHAIVERDHWMIQHSDVALFNFLGAQSVSIGMTMELGWASQWGVHTVGILPEGNPHYHAFILEALDVRFDTWQEAIEYLEKLGLGAF